jgi:DNA-binding transcriptional LysR family regulator
MLPRRTALRMAPRDRTLPWPRQVPASVAWRMRSAPRSWRAIVVAFVGLPADSALQRHIAGHAARLGKSMKVRARVTGFDAVCRMVEAGAGIGIVPEASASRCRPSMRIESVRLSDPWASRRLAICARDLRSLPTGALRLVAHLRAAAPPAS